MESHPLYPIGKHVHYYGKDYVVVANEVEPFTEKVAEKFHVSTGNKKFRIFPLDFFDYLIAEYTVGQ